MSLYSERTRHEREMDKAFDDIVSMIDPLSWVNGWVMFLASMHFGAEWWKAVIIGIVGMLATRFHYGRRLLVKGCIILMIVTLVSWSDTLPDMRWIASAAQNCFKT